MTGPEFAWWLNRQHACEEAVVWVAGRDLATAWAECGRADWMLWLYPRLRPDDRAGLVLAACGCARTALRYVPTGEDRPRLAIEAAEAWARDPSEANRLTCAAARDAADAAAEEVADNAAYLAAVVAANAVPLAVASTVAYAVAYAARRATADVAAVEVAHGEMCGLIRERLSVA